MIDNRQRRQRARNEYERQIEGCKESVGDSGKRYLSRKEDGVQSQKALEQWAREHGWRVVFLDAESGNPRTGIVDAVLVRVRPKEPDTLDIKLVQLKAGSAGLKAREMKRLCNSVSNLSAEHLIVLYDGEELMFSPSEPD